MALFGLKKDTCFYCRMPVEKGQEHQAPVTVIGYVGTFNKKFCSEEHTAAYNEDIKNRPKNSGGSCCH